MVHLFVLRPIHFTQLHSGNYLLPFVALAAVFLVGYSAIADSIALNPIRDNTLIQEASGLRSNGAGIGIFSGRINTTGGGARLRAVLAFDLTAIPPGSTINSVALTLNVIQTSSGTQIHELHRLLADWGEGISDSGGGLGAPSTPGDATWIHTFYPDSFWNNPGGDFVAAPSDTQRAPGTEGPVTFSSVAMQQDVQLWVNSASSNHGWIVLGNESIVNTAKKFASRENDEVTLRPLLEITYSPPCAADITHDGHLNVSDLLAVIGNWGPCPSPCTPPSVNCPADIIRDCTVNVTDLLAVINAYGQSCR